MKTFTTLFFHGRSIMNQQDTIKEKDKIIRNKYFLNNMERVIWGLHHDCWGTRFSGMLCHVVGSVLPDVLEKRTPSSGTHNTDDEGQTFLQNARKKLPNHSVHQPKKTWLFTTKHVCHHYKPSALCHVQWVVQQWSSNTWNPSYKYFS